MSFYSHTLAATGDSQTDPAATGVGNLPSQTWPSVLARTLRDRGASIKARNFGHAGFTSTQNLANVAGMFLYDTPDLAIIYTAVNDPGNSITQATTQANIQAKIRALKHGVTGPGNCTGAVTVATEASLPANGRPGQRYLVLADGSSTGGVTADAAMVTAGKQVATITGAGGGVMNVWENRNPLAGVRGWGRVATAATTPTVVKRIVVVSANYLNFSSGGDTPSTDYATYATVRTAQAAAVTAENVNIGGVASVVFADLHAFQKARIVAGTDPNFSADTAIVAHTAYTQALSWHAADSNQHHNHYGQWLVVQAILAVIPTAWLTALGAT